MTKLKLIIFFDLIIVLLLLLHTMRLWWSRLRWKTQCEFHLDYHHSYSIHQSVQSPLALLLHLPRAKKYLYSSNKIYIICFFLLLFVVGISFSGRMRTLLEYNWLRMNVWVSYSNKHIYLCVRQQGANVPSSSHRHIIDTIE